MTPSGVEKTRRRPVRVARQGAVGAISDATPSRDDESLPYISASMRASFKRCRYAWHFRYMRKLEPKHSAPALRFGTLIHTALEHYYPVGIKRGPHPARVFEKAYEKEFGEALVLGFKDEDGKWQDALSLGVDMLEHYVAHYGKDEEWEVIATEQMFRQPVVNEAGKTVGIYIGVLDNILKNRATGNIWIRDHKGVKTIDTEYLSMDDQSSGYWTYGQPWLLEQGILEPGQKLMGIEFNFLRKAKRDERPKNAKGHYTNQPTKVHYVAALAQYGATDKMTVAALQELADAKKVIVLGDVSEKQPPAYFVRFPSRRGAHERMLTNQRIIAELDEMQQVKAGTLALLKSPDKMSCKFCDVSDICELHEIGADWEEMMRMIMVDRRPIVREAIQFEHDH